MDSPYTLTTPHGIQLFIQDVLGDGNDASLDVPQPLLASLTSRDAQIVLDEIWKVLDSPVLPNAVNGGIIFFEYRNKLRKLCLKVANNHSLLPAALILKDVRTIDSVQRAGGGNADVFCGTYHENRVALKRLRVYMMSTDTQKEKIRQAFYRESILWKGLVHEHIAPFLGVSEDVFGGLICMVLPWFDNGNVRSHLDKIRRGGVDSNKLLRSVDRWLHQTALGLEYLHHEGIVHGDLHPGNILIDDNENARITDFGMSLIAEATAYNYASIHGGGALRWKAPELVDPEEFDIETSRPTKKSDVFSIACTAIDLYSGNPPFPELADHQVSKRYVKGKRPPRPPLPGDGSGVMSSAMWAIVEACWAQDYTKRPSAHDIAARMAENRRSTSLPSNGPAESTVTIETQEIRTTIPRLPPLVASFRDTQDQISRKMTPPPRPPAPPPSRRLTDRPYPLIPHVRPSPSLTPPRGVHLPIVPLPPLTPSPLLAYPEDDPFRVGLPVRFARVRPHQLEVFQDPPHFYSPQRVPHTPLSRDPRNPSSVSPSFFSSLLYRLFNPKFTRSRTSPRHGESAPTRSSNRRVHHSSSHPLVQHDPFPGPPYPLPGYAFPLGFDSGVSYNDSNSSVSFLPPPVVPESHMPLPPPPRSLLPPHVPSSPSPPPSPVPSFISYSSPYSPPSPPTPAKPIQTDKPAPHSKFNFWRRKS